MRRVLFFLLVVFTAQLSVGQNVGIGTTSPNSKAILDINSTTRGILVPSMTTTQRLAITSPPNGLLVYDTDKSEFYHFNATSWSPLLNGDYWSRPNTNRRRISNLLDSVGVGLSSPTEWLDVDGNIRTRNNLLADNNITATGAISGGSLAASGNLLTTGTGFINGSLTTNSDLIINNTGATMQLKSAGENKGYFQLSGDNVRMGTNSGNSTGNLIVRMNGNDRITIAPNGNIDLDGKITRAAVTGTSSLLPICFGFIKNDGTILNGTGNFSVVRISEGQYRITCNDLNIYSVILITTISPDRVAGAFQSAPTTVEIEIRSNSASGYRDEYFSFLIYRPG